MKPLSITLVLLIAFSTLFGQADWVAGSITTSTGQTVEGEISRMVWNDAIEYLSFRKGEAGKVEDYPIANLASFAIEGTFFRIADVEINTSPRESGALVKVADKKTKVLKGILKQISNGSIELYELNTRNVSNHYFMCKGGGELEYLSFGRYYKIDPNGNRIVYELNEYRFQLNEALTACPSLIKEISTAGYTKNTLTKLFSQYYDCIGEIVLKKPKGKLTIKPGLVAVAGSQKSNAEIFRDVPLSRDDAFFPSWLYLSGGVFARTYFNSEQKISVRAELRYHQTSHEFARMRQIVTTSLTLIDREVFEEKSLAFRLVGEFVIINSQKPLMVTAGLSVDYLLKSFYEVSEERTFAGMLSVDIKRTGSPISQGPTLLTPDLGLVWRLGKVNLGASYNYYSGRNVGFNGSRYLMRVYYEL